MFSPEEIEFAMHGCRQQILKVLRGEEGPLAEGALVERVRLSRKVVSADLSKLVEAGLVEAYTEGGGGRRVAITERGRTLADYLDKLEPDMSHVH
jgi:DNA-binding transcriptional ArsR family regulator